MSDRRGKLFRKKMWAVINRRGKWIILESYQEAPWRKHDAEWRSTCYGGAEPIKVLVSEIPKPSPRKKVRRGK